MPAGPPICQLAASARRIGASGSSGAHPWNTPTLAERVRSPEMLDKLTARRNERAGQTTTPLYLCEQAHYDQMTWAPWPTPTEGDAKSSGSRNLEGSKAHPGISLTDAAMFGNSTTPRASWPTPTVSQQNGGDPVATPGMAARAVRRGPGNLLEGVALATWPTPKASDGEGGRTTKTEGGGNAHLPIVARETAAWATPKERDWRSPRISPEARARRNAETRGKGLEEQTFGTAPSGESAQTEKRGALNPEFVSWLMGFPTAWVSCGASATRSSRKPRPCS